MEVKKIKTTNNDGTITEIEVSFDVWQFDEEDKWKTIYQKEKNKGVIFSYDEICYRQESREIAKIPKQLSDASAENEYIKTYSKHKQNPLIQKLYEAINQLSKKQRRRIILKFFQDMTFAKIAKIENCTERAVYLTISNALNSLNKILNKING